MEINPDKKEQILRKLKERWWLVPNQCIVIGGLGVTGKSLVNLFSTLGFKVSVTEGTDNQRTRDAAAMLAKSIDDVELGVHTQRIFAKSKAFFPSPGIPQNAPPFSYAKRAGIPIIGDIELAFHITSTPVIAVTGTNGKSTTALLIQSMLQAAGIKAGLGGNYGKPLVDIAIDDHKLQYIVAEVSSFQLQYVEVFKPYVAVILNIAPDHLDWHANFEEYAKSKARITVNQEPNDYLAFNNTDDLVCRIASASKATRIAFGTRSLPALDGIYRDGEKICALWKGKETIYMDSGMVNALPEYLLQDSMAALSAVLPILDDARRCIKVIKEFKPLAHRQQLVADIHGIKAVDDSKATNVHAAVISLRSQKAPLILIAGGVHKRGDYAALAREAKGKVKLAVLIGEAAGLIEDALKDICPVKRAMNMSEAVDIAVFEALIGDTILLAPACSSFDMYDNYLARGDDFSVKVKQRLEMKKKEKQ